jgi:uncharacterized protein YigA (DUF484 family)
MNDRLSDVLERVRGWPEDRQADAARLLLEMEALDTSPYRLSDEQLAEVRRRRGKTSPGYVGLAEARERFSRPRK